MFEFLYDDWLRSFDQNAGQTFLLARTGSSIVFHDEEYDRALITHEGRECDSSDVVCSMYPLRRDSGDDRRGMMFLVWCKKMICSKCMQVSTLVDPGWYVIRTIRGVKTAQYYKIGEDSWTNRVYDSLLRERDFRLDVTFEDLDEVGDGYNRIRRGRSPEVRRRGCNPTCTNDSLNVSERRGENGGKVLSRPTGAVLDRDKVRHGSSGGDLHKLLFTMKKRKREKSMEEREDRSFDYDALFTHYFWSELESLKRKSGMYYNVYAMMHIRFRNWRLDRYDEEWLRSLDAVVEEIEVESGWDEDNEEEGEVPYRINASANDSAEVVLSKDDEVIYTDKDRGRK